MFGVGGNGHFFVVFQKIADNDVDIPLFYEFGRAFSAVERAEVGQKGTVEILVRKVRGQRFGLKDPREIVRIARADDEHVIHVIGRGHERMRAALVHEYDLVFSAAEIIPVHLAVHVSADDVQNLYAAVKVCRGIGIAAFEKFYAVGLVVAQFIEG